MADRFDQEIAALDAQFGAPVSFGTPGPFQTDGPGIGENLFTMGAGSLLAGLENIDQLFGNVARNLLGGNFGEAGESFLRGLLPGDFIEQTTGLGFLNMERTLFGDKPFDPFTGEELLEKYGVGNVEDVLFNIDSRTIGGIGVDILTDPLNLFGGLIAKGIGKVGAGLGMPALRFVEGLAGQRSVVNAASSAFRGGRKLADIIDIPQINVGLHASFAAAGAALGGFSDEDAAFSPGGAVLGGLGGLALGAGAANLPRLASGALKVGDTFSDVFKVGRRQGFEEGQRFVEETKELIPGHAKQIINQSVRRRQEFDEALLEQIEATAANARGLDVGEELAAAQRELTALSETPGLPELVAERVGGTAGGRFGSKMDELKPLAPSELTIGGSHVRLEEFKRGAEALDEVVTRLKKSGITGEELDEAIEYATGVLEHGGKDNVARILKRFDDLPEQSQKIFTRYHAGDPLDLLMPGRIDVTNAMIDRGILDRHLITGMISRTGVSFMPHVRGSGTVEEAVMGILGELKEGGLNFSDFGVAEFGSALKEARSRFAEIAREGKHSLKARKLMRSIEEINAKYGTGFLEESFTKLGVEDVRRWTSLESAREMVEFTARDIEDGGFVHNLARLVDDAEKGGDQELLETVVRGIVEGDQVMVTSKDILPQFRKHFTRTAKDRRVIERIEAIADDIMNAGDPSDFALVEQARQFEARVASEMSKVRQAVDEIQNFKRGKSPNTVVVENAQELRRLETAIDRAAKRLESIIGEPTTPSFTPDDFLDVGPTTGAAAAKQANAASMADRLRRIKAARTQLANAKGRLVSGRPQTIDLPSELLDVRALDTLEDALLRGRDLGKAPGTPQQIAKARKGVQETAARRAELRKELKALQRKGDTTEVPVVMSKTLFDDLFGATGAVERLMDPKVAQGWLKTWRAMNKMWTGWTLGPFASWMTRNFAGNLWNNALSGIGPTHIRDYYKVGRHVQEDIAKFLGRRADEITGTIKIAGKTWNRRDLVEELVEMQIVQSGFASSAGGEELLRILSPQELFRRTKKGLKGGKLRAAQDVFARDPQQNLMSRTGFSINGLLEDIPRIVHYAVKRSAKHGDLDKHLARRSTLKALGNFSEMSQGDQFLREAMPFWAWTRFNIPRQIRGLAEGLGGDITKGIKGVKVGPVPTVAHIKLELDEENRAAIPDVLIPEYLQGQLALPMGINPDGEFEFWSLNRWLPLADLTEIDSPQKMLQFLSNSVSPFLSEPFEQAFNFDTFYKDVIQRYPGEQEHILGYSLDKRSAHLLRNLRIVTEADTWFSKILDITPAKDRLGAELSWYQRLMAAPGKVFSVESARQFSGLKGRTVNLKDAKKFRVLDLKRTAGHLKRLVKRARKKGDTDNERNYRRLWLETKQQLKMAKRFKPERNPHFRALELDQSSR